MNRIYLALSLLLLIISVILCQQIIVHSQENQRNKSEWAELNDAKYGLFSIDAWKEKLIKIVTSEFDSIYLSDATEEELRRHISVILEKMIEEASAKIEKTNRKTATGKVKQLFIDIFIDINDLKKGIPEYTDAVISELKNPKTKSQIRAMVSEQLTEYSKQTTDEHDKSQLDAILEETSSTDKTLAASKINKIIFKKSELIKKESIALIILSIFIFVLFYLNRRPHPSIQYLMVITSLGLLLASGIATPMIDMEAKITELKIILIGHPIAFQNQILYFQSKSILDVFMLLITDPLLRMKFVGILIVTFSVFFPVMKLLSSLGYYYNYFSARKSRLVDFFVFQSGKWSMADVMVVAIFMAYIGFNGVINSQMNSLSSQGGGAEIIATNGTTLEPGYFLFLAFVLLALLMSTILKKKSSL